MPGILQEKFQVDFPSQGNDDSHSGWKTDNGARVKKGIPHGGSAMFGSLPPGMDIEDQENTDIRKMKKVMSGASDESHDWSPEAIRRGYTKRAMSPTEDQYTREHNDTFYDEMTVDGSTGFVERNNVLDRM